MRHGALLPWTPSRSRARRRTRAVAAGGVGADVEEFRGDAERAAEEVRVDAEKTGKALQRGHLPLKGGVGEGELVLLGLAGFGNSLLARELVGELAESGGVARARQAIPRGLLERIEGAGERALRLAGHRGFVRRAEAGIVENILKLRQQQVSDLLLLAEELLVERVDIGALLIGHLPRVGLCAASHGSPPERLESEDVNEVKAIKEVKEKELDDHLVDSEARFCSRSLSSFTSFTSFTSSTSL